MQSAPLAAALAEEIADPLNSRIAELLSDASHDADTPVAVDGWVPPRSGRSRRSASSPAITSSWRSAGRVRRHDDDQLRWVVDDDGTPCPDCDDNALAGPTPKGEHYPTGQAHLQHTRLPLRAPPRLVSVRASRHDLPRAPAGRAGA